MQTLVPQRLWTDYRTMKAVGLPLGRRVGIARGSAGQLVVFSPLEANAQTLDELRGLGEIAAFVVPSLFHDRFFPEYFSAFPKATFLAGAASVTANPGWPLKPLSGDLPELAGFRSTLIEGMPRVREHVFLHESTRTLVLADLLFNLPGPHGPLAHLMLKLAGMTGPAGPSRLWRACIGNRAEFSASLRGILAWDFDRILPGHGAIVEAGGRRVFENAFAEWLKP